MLMLHAARPQLRPAQHGGSQHLEVTWHAGKQLHHGAHLMARGRGCRRTSQARQHVKRDSIGHLHASLRAEQRSGATALCTGLEQVTTGGVLCSTFVEISSQPLQQQVRTIGRPIDRSRVRSADLSILRSERQQLTSVALRRGPVLMCHQRGVSFQMEVRCLGREGTYSDRWVMPSGVRGGRQETSSEKVLHRAGVTPRNNFCAKGGGRVGRRLSGTHTPERANRKQSRWNATVRGTEATRSDDGRDAPSEGTVVPPRVA